MNWLEILDCNVINLITYSWDGFLIITNDMESLSEKISAPQTHLNLLNE
jgi:hypothetical protein